MLIAYPCSRFRITGHYFALVTLALSAIVLQVVTATRDITGGSLGYTPERYQGGNSIYALQFTGKQTWYLIALAIWAAGLLIRWRVDRSMLRYALEAIAEDEAAARRRRRARDGGEAEDHRAECGDDRVRRRDLLPVPDVHLARHRQRRYVSLQMVFAAVVGGLYVLLGPTVGALITIVLTETLRISFGTAAVGWDNLVYGALLVVFIIFLPQGLVGSLRLKPAGARVRTA